MVVRPHSLLRNLLYDIQGTVIDALDVTDRQLFHQIVQDHLKASPTVWTQAPTEDKSITELFELIDTFEFIHRSVAWTIMQPVQQLLVSRFLNEFSSLPPVHLLNDRYDLPEYLLAAVEVE